MEKRHGGKIILLLHCCLKRGLKQRHQPSARGFRPRIALNSTRPCYDLFIGIQRVLFMALPLQELSQAKQGFAADCGVGMLLGDIQQNRDR